MCENKIESISHLMTEEAIRIDFIKKVEKREKLNHLSLSLVFPIDFLFFYHPHNVTR